MTFANVTSQLKDGCQCIERGTENTEDIFLHALFAEHATERDFRTIWETQRHRCIKTKCKDICKYHGVSFNKLESDNEAIAIEKYKNIASKISADSRRIAPAIPSWKYYCKAKFKLDAGVVWPDGTTEERHVNFFKCDTFQPNCLEYISIELL